MNVYQKSSAFLLHFIYLFICGGEGSVDCRINYPAPISSQLHTYKVAHVYRSC